ncbi:PAS domain S-box protein [Stagnimonas aquatica]|uniref:PAS domain S-box protein n=1 Tax=Stagnimonas aquatica TaxID=2689987 RepID=A0A3N0VDE6_9GAMM|nr:PAS domain S-box protein [Stagnimonas aquatica]ROH90793.1 PAS domain S-box protein [Stagnimonas aquatica]
MNPDPTGVLAWLPQAAERRRTLLLNNLLVILLCFSYTWVLQSLPGALSYETRLFTAVGGILLVLSLALWRDWIGYLTAASLSVGLASLLLVERLLAIFTGPLLDDPTQSLFMPVFSYYVLLYLAILVLLPYPASALAGVIAWLLLASVTTVLSYPQFQSLPARPMLAATLVYVWLGHGSLVLLLFSAAWVQKRLADQLSAAAVAERESRQLAQQAEAAWARQRQVLQFHIENTPLAVIEWNSQLRLTGWSRRAEQIFGWSAAEVLGKSPFEWPFIHDDDEAKVRELEQRIQNGSDLQLTIECRNHRRDGSIAHCCWYNSILRDARGEPLSVFALVDDISEGQAAVHGLRQSEALLRSLFDQAGVGIALFDDQGRWLSMNQRLCELTGYREDELQALNMDAITHPADPGNDQRLVRRLLAGELSSYRCEKRFRRKDGGEAWVMINARRIETAYPAPARYVKLLEDISDLKASQARVQALNASLENRVTQRTNQLHEAINEAERRGRDLRRIAEMTGLLGGARDLREAMKIVAHTGRRLFPDVQAALYLIGEAPERFVLQEHWGGEPPPAGFEPAECWAVRRGREHRIEDCLDELRCGHHHHLASEQPRTCLPLVALGQTVGLLSLAWQARPDGWAPEPVLLQSLAEQVGLAIGNVRLREELRRQSVHDPVTGLGNRQQLEQHLRRRAAEQARGGRGFGLLRMDVDDYTGLLERFGLDAVEALLRELAELLQQATRTEEPLFRHGPGEFAIVLVGDDPELARLAVQRVQAQVQVQGLSFSPRGQPLPPVQLSLGLALYPRDAVSPPQLIEQASKALELQRRQPRLAPPVIGALER